MTCSATAHQARSSSPSTVKTNGQSPMPDAYLLANSFPPPGSFAKIESRFPHPSRQRKSDDACQQFSNYQSNTTTTSGVHLITANPRCADDGQTEKRREEEVEITRNERAFPLSPMSAAFIVHG